MRLCSQAKQACDEFPCPVLSLSPARLLAEAAGERGRAVALREDLSGRQRDETLHGGDHHIITKRRRCLVARKRHGLSRVARHRDASIML